MSLCRDYITLTFDGVRADDGGQPEELNVYITKFTDDPFSDPIPEYPPEPYDARYDNEFIFSPMRDGNYKVQYIGAISGVIEKEVVLVSLNAKNDVGNQACKDVKALMTNKCLDTDYMVKKSLIAMGVAFTNCERFFESERALDDVINFDDCDTKIAGCGCS